jgi:xanthine dehydrogenase YagS FAD-binding subunit
MNPFTVSSPATVADAAATLAKGGAAILAGGSELLYHLKAMNSPATPPATLVNLKTIPNLAYIKEEGGMLKIGALTKLVTIATDTTVLSKYTALAQAAKAVASPELRNQGTIGGNICQGVQCWYYRADDNLFNCLRKDSKGLCYAMLGDNRYHSIFGGVGGCFAVNPSDTAAALTAFGASIVTNKKTWAIKDFFAVNGEKTTALAADEIVTEIQVPTPAAGTKSAFIKFALRKSFDFPIVNCAAVITQSSGSVSAASIALNAVYNLPRKATDAENSIKGKAISAATAEAAGAAAVNGVTVMPSNIAAMPSTGITTGNKYMVQIAKTLVKRAILACA